MLHIMVNVATNSYMVIVARSCGNEGGDLSKCIKVFDSLTCIWIRTGNVLNSKFV